MAASTLRSPQVLASAAGAAIGGVLLWRWLSSRSLATSRAPLATRFTAAEERVHRAEDRALANGSKSQGSRTIKDEDPIPLAFEPESDDDESFCPEIEEQQCMLVGELLQSLHAAAVLGDASPVGEKLSKAISELQVYRQRLADTDRIASLGSQLRQTAEAMQMLLLADDERDLMAIVRRRAQEISELTELLEALEKVNSTDVNEGDAIQAKSGSGKTCCGGGRCGNQTAAANSVQSASSCCGGSKRGSCAESTRKDAETSGMLDLSVLVAQCATSEELSALCNRLVERELSSVLAANPHLEFVPEQRKRVIRAQIEATLATVAEENTMLATRVSSCGSHGGCQSVPGKGSCADQDATNSSSSPVVHLGSDGTVKLSRDRLIL